jgi:MoaA/NifB/PqqE/SkfB family radical SAM enzyme
MKDAPDYTRQIENELGLDTCNLVLKRYWSFLERYRIPGRINFTGGDPLLKAGILDLIRVASTKGIRVGILGNPETLDLQTARRLKKAGVFRFQVSLDGMAETHDRIRGRPGSFDATLEAIRTLNSVRIPSVVMFTVSKQNMADLVDVIDLVAKEKVSIFDFSRIVPMGRASNVDCMDPGEYRQLLISVLSRYKELHATGCRTHFGRKDPLWNLLYHEFGLSGVDKLPGGVVFSGCSVGNRILTILADGTVYPCRRLPVELGHLPRDDFDWLVRRHPVSEQLRDIASLKKCGQCSILRFCRGCRAIASARNGHHLDPDPQCWRRDEDLGQRDPKKYTLKDFAFWKGKVFRSCTSCDEGCGACASVCGACSEVCASCSGCDV